MSSSFLVKNILCLVLAFWLVSGAINAQEIQINEDPKITQLQRNWVNANRATPKVDGWRVQIMARIYGEFYHARGPAAELRDMMLGARTPEQSLEGVAWLYGTS